MQLNNLKHIHCLMREDKTYRGFFTYTYLGKNFRCIFLTDISPAYKLYLCPVGINSFKIELDVKLGYEINPTLSKTVYDSLVNYLGLTGKSFRVFPPTELFNDFNHSLINIKAITIPKYSDVLIINHDNKNIEEAFKPYFWHWKKNPNDGINHVSPLNYNKTELSFGKEFADTMKKYNISSCWTPNINEEDMDKLVQYAKIPVYH